MLLNIALKFPRLARPRPVLATVSTEKYTFLSELRKKRKQNCLRHICGKKILQLLQLKFEIREKFKCKQMMCP